MKQFSDHRILGHVSADEFVGRTVELERLIDLAGTGTGAGSKGLALLAAPNSGSSELLRQVYDRLFVEQEEVIPVYFRVTKSDGSALQSARRFLREFLVQTVAFRRRNAFVLDSSPDINEIAELAVPADGLWIDRLIETASEYGNDDDSSRVRSFLSSPLRAAASGANVFVMIDDLHETAKLTGGSDFLETLTNVLARSDMPFVMCGHRRFLYGKTPFDSMTLGRLSFAESGQLAESLALREDVALNEQTRDLIAVQLQGDPIFMGHLLAAAGKKGLGCESFQQFENVYAGELFGGRISRHFDAIFDELLPDTASRSRIIAMLADLLNDDSNRSTLDFWQTHAALSPDQFRSLTSALHDHEFAAVGSNSIEAFPENIVFADYITARHRLETNDNGRARIVGDELARYIKRAPQLMARFYRQISAIGLREVMQAFDGRDVARSLIDYGTFEADLKGLPDGEVQQAITTADEKISLPQIIYTAHSVAFYRQIGDLIDAERSAIALGFERPETGETVEDIVWIAAEIDSKLEVAADVTEFWCDRLEMVAANCYFKAFKIWLVAPEGFSANARQILAKRNAIGSSRRQVDLLVRQLSGSALVPASAADEYEIVIPMGDDTEMIAAHTVEEIAKRHNFPAKAINQIKTALVEACINASEHSLSPDRKIYQKFAVDHDKITITVSNRGLRLLDKAAIQVTTQEGRRGWGLKLIQNLMDEVKVDQTDDGTRITMMKRISVVALSAN